MDAFYTVLILGLFVFLPLWLILKIGDFIERYFPALWARMGHRPDQRRQLRRGARDRGDGGGDGGGGGLGDGGGGA